jgi:Holliday junction resolvase RusA-like endonuclease
VSARILTNVFVPGNPKTKGSLDLMPARRGGRPGRVYARENVSGSTEWRRQVARAVKRDQATRGIYAPWAGAVAVRLVFWLPVPVDVGRALDEYGVTAEDVEAVAGGDGDIDKLVRNVLDAMGSSSADDARVYDDDVQVTRVVVDKVYAVGNEPRGALVMAWGRAPSELSAVRHAVRAEMRGATRLPAAVGW